MRSNGIRPAQITVGPVRVRLVGVVKGDAAGNPVASINAPNAAEAMAALDRAARVSGADGVIKASSDYRRMALAAGPLQTRWQIEVHASGTAIASEKDAVEPEDE